MQYYSITGLVVGIDFGLIQGHKELENFRIGDYEGSADILISFDYSDNDLKYLYKYENDERFLCSADIQDVFEEKDCYTVRIKRPELVYGYKVFKQNKEAIIYIKTDDIEQCNTVDVTFSEMEEDIYYQQFNGGELLLYCIRDAFFLQALKHGRVPIHSSSVLYRDKVWMFSAPSGVGKTTHVNLWGKAGIEHSVFNGDVCLLYRDGDKIFAGALPWSGTAEAFSLEDRPLGGVFFLKQAQDNKINELSSSDRVLKIVMRALVANWDRILVSNILDIVEDIEPDILVAELECNISTEAALCSKQYIDNNI